MEISRAIFCRLDTALLYNAVLLCIHTPSPLVFYSGPEDEETNFKANSNLERIASPTFSSRDSYSNVALFCRYYSSSGEVQITSSASDWEI